VCFAFQIYYDFSAYSDIAIGTAKLFNIELMRNFAYPYFSRSMAEFWRRWHISLSGWFRDYVFLPINGLRAKNGRLATSLLLTFVLSGLWHGASWNFILWGAIHGLALIPGALWFRSKARAIDTVGGEPLLPRPQTLWAMLRTFALVCFAWIFFRATSLPDALLIIKKIVLEGLSGQGYGALLEESIHTTAQKITLLLLCVTLTLEWVYRRQDHPLMFAGWPTSLRWLCYTSLFWITIFFKGGMGAFIYFQF
jgi:D-alanyl-lipoteichoic acid acyltransferase DltB (MBOAT superfamily)